ncbi:MAG: Wzz/FepE/Etk N-terminal domain-containing protein [Bacteroidota bacterium]|nr:Wzz/FepE/Etk N-terminal domain-containing protein [Bacteroidota bacterium]
MEEESQFNIDYLELATHLWAKRKTIVKLFFILNVGAVIVLFLIHNSYESSTIILPEGKQSSLGGLSGLASLAGVDLGSGSDLQKTYPDILVSESILRQVIYDKYKTLEFSDSVTLVQYWEIREKDKVKEFEIALKSLRTYLQINTDKKTGILTVSIITKEPQLSADIVNNTISHLDQFLRTRNKTNAKERKEWLEHRLIEVSADLSKSETNLKDFREKNRRVTDSPELLLQQERFIREVQINTTLFSELKKQFELAKLDEIKDIPLVNILDEARPTAQKIAPKRLQNLLIINFISFVGIFGYFIILHLFGTRIDGIRSKVMGIVKS